MKNKMNSIYVGTISTAKNGKAVHQAVRKMRAFEQAQKEMSGLNTMRGGNKGFKGFVGESMEAAEASARGRNTIVLNNNGLADLKHLKTDGTTAFQQVKIGYKPGQIDFARYKGQTIVVDKGNPHFRALKAEAAKSGVKVVEGHITEQEAKFWADAMQLETKVTGKTNATVVPKFYQSAKTAAAAHRAGVSAAKSGAAAGDVIVDTAEAGAISYGAGAAGSLLASTEIGAAALETAGTVGAVISEAPVIGSAIGAGTAITGAIGGVSASAAAAATGAVTGAVTSAAAAASSVAAGTAAAGAVGAISSGAVAAAATIGAATVAAAPVLVVGGIIGGLISLFDD